MRRERRTNLKKRERMGLKAAECSYVEDEGEQERKTAQTYKHSTKEIKKSGGSELIVPSRVGELSLVTHPVHTSARAP